MMDDHRDARAESNKAFAGLDKKVDLHIQKTEYELRRINDQDEIQNQLLDKHIEGVNTLRLIHEEHVRENNIRFSSIEQPKKVLKGITKAVLWLGGVGTAVMAIHELVKWLGM